MFKNRFLVAAPLVLIALTLASFFSLTARSVSADDVVDVVSIRVNVSCTMSGSGMNTHNATVNPGTFETNIGETTFRVFCNDNEGFAIYTIGFTDDTDGKNVLTSAVVGSTYDIATGTGTSGNSQWAMKLATDANATYPITLQNGFGSWHTVPDDYTLVAKRTAHTDVGMNAVGANFTSTYQVFITSSQPAGNYNGRVKYVMVHPATHFAPVACNPSATTIAEVKCMQDFASQNRDAIVTSMALEQQYTLKDNRDGKTYTVAKLADGNVWMTQNLDHDIVTDTDFYTYYNTDIGHGEIINTDAKWTADKATYATGDNTWDNTSTGNYIQQSYDPGDKIWDGVVYSWNDSPTLDTMNQGTNTHYSIGNYYSWSAAVAMNDTSSYTVANTDANQSICPAGWMLPKGNGNTNSPASFGYLARAYNYNPDSEIMNDPYIWESPLYFSLSGQYTGEGGDTRVGRWSSAWTSVTDYGSYAYNLDAVDDPAYIPGGGSRSEGLSVRCVVR
ncbi:hypothetical protein J6V85_01870 [Candidatus Saccharibacteria bacterium]|nr:hypothetical protein [Candidatus Saccharibacteria bacterium]